MNQSSLPTCPACGSLFLRKREGQQFCSGKCRSAYARETGLTGKVKSIRSLVSGATMVIHFPTENALRAFQLRIGEEVRVSRV